MDQSIPDYELFHFENRCTVGNTLSQIHVRHVVSRTTAKDCYSLKASNFCFMTDRLFSQNLAGRHIREVRVHPRVLTIQKSDMPSTRYISQNIDKHGEFNNRNVE